MGWIIAAIAIVGIGLNAAGKWQGFGCWLISNAYWAYHNAMIGEYEQAVLFAIFWLLSVYGLFIWLEAASKRQRREKKIKEMAEMVLDAKRKLDDREKKKIKINGLVDLAEEILEEKGN